MLLPTFARLLTQEQPRVQAALEQAVDRLPASVREVAGYVLLAGGKRLRPLLTLTAARLFGCERSLRSGRRPGNDPRGFAVA